MFKWYVMNVIFGYEKEVIHLIKLTAKRCVASDLFKNFLILKKECYNKKKINRNSFEGYIFIKILPNILTFSIIRNIQYVIKILGTNYTPLQLNQKEIISFIEKIKSKKYIKGTRAIFNIGESVYILEGIFKRFTGCIKKINKKKEQLKVFISIFGRGTSIYLSFNQVKKNNNYYESHR